MIPNLNIDKVLTGDQVQYLQTRLFPVCILQEKGM